MENQWLSYAKRLQAVASTGLHYARDQYDRDRYAEIAEIAQRMMADLGNVPVERIVGLVSEFAKGYSTPKVDVRAAVIEDDSVLLVQERSDLLWTLPGGFADVGLSATENIRKEVEEEACLQVKVQALYGVRHKAKRAYEPDARDFYKLFFLCEPMEACTPAPGWETADARFFRRGELPPLSRARVLEEDIEAAFLFREDPVRMAAFD